MPKQVLLYGHINTYSAAEFVQAIEENKNSDITVRVNSGGGEPESGWAMIARFKEHGKKKVMKAEGKVYSMACFLLCYADDVECLDVTQFMLHRAAYAEWVESSESMDQSMWDSLKKINDNLRKALEAKVDAVKFAQVTGTTIEQLFTTPGRIDVELTAEQAKEIGLVNRINKITPELTAMINRDVDSFYERAAKVDKLDLRIAAETTEPKTKNQNKMTLQELKAQHPEAYAQAVTEGVTQERDRVEACLVFMDVDAKGVKEAIESGKPLSSKKMAEFALKQTSPEAMKKLEAEAAKDTQTDPPAGVVTAEQKEVADFEAQLDSKLGIKKPTA